MNAVKLGDHIFCAQYISCMKKGDKKGTTLVWVAGQSAIDGNFIVDEEYDSAVDLWLTALNDEDEDEEEDDASK